MNCETCKALLDQRLMGGLEERRQAELDAHLNACLACRMRLQVLEDCRAMGEPDEVPVSFSQTWRQAIREEAPAPRKTRRMPAKWLAMAAALVLMMTGAWQLRSRPALPAVSVQPEAYMAEPAALPVLADEMQEEASEAPEMALGQDTAKATARAAAPQEGEARPDIGPWALLGAGLLLLLAMTIQTMMQRRNKK